MEPEVKEVVRLLVRNHDKISAEWGPNGWANRELADALLELGVKSVTTSNEVTTVEYYDN